MNRFAMVLKGELNAVPFVVQGCGDRDSLAGIVRGRYTLQRNDTRTEDIAGLSHWVFNSMILTGYPSESLAQPGTVNPFRGKSYSYRRSLRFLGHGEAHLEAAVQFTAGDVLDSSFRVHGDIRVPVLVSVEPTVETWIPRGPGKVFGSFVMSWLTEDGDRVVAVAESDYEIEGSPACDFAPQHRWIEIRAEGTQREFTRHQRSILLARPSRTIEE